MAIPRAKRAWLALVALGVTLGTVAYGAPWLGLQTQTALYAFLTVAATFGASLLAARQARLAMQFGHRIGWGLLAGAALAWGIGETWHSAMLLTQGHSVGPGWHDVPHLLSYPLMVSGILAFAARRGTPGIGTVRAMDAGLVSGVLFLAGWVTVLQSLVGKSGTSLPAVATAVLYPLGDLLVLSALGLTLVSLDRDARVRLWGVLVGLALLAMGDLAGTYQVLQTGALGTPWADLAGAAGAMLVALAALGPPLPPAASRELPSQGEHWMPLAAMVALFPLLLADLIDDGQVDGVTGGLFVALGLTMVGRQALLVDIHVRLSRSLLSAQHAAGVGAWAWSPRHQRLQFSDSALPLLGMEPTQADLAFGDFLLRVHPGDRPALQAHWQALQERGKALDTVVRIPVGSQVRHVRMTGAQAQGALGVSGTLQDQTHEVCLREEQARALALKSEAERLQEVNRFKTHFINTAAHELNTPLTPIMISLATLKRGGDTPRPRTDTLALLERNVDRLVRLLRDVLDSARLQSDRLRLELRILDLAALAREAVEEHRLVAEERGVRLQLEVQPTPVRADAGRLGEVLMNLLSNAVKFTPPGGEVILQVRREAGHARLAVRDTGRGIEGSDIERLFQPFAQVGQSLHDPTHGTGLGLYIAHEIVSRLGGRIWVESEGLGKGSTFHVELPAAPESEAAVAGIATT